MTTVVNTPAVQQVVYNGGRLHTYNANVGQGLAQHEHPYEHAVLCVAGKLAVRKEHLYLELTPKDPAVALRENEWHELEALVDNTVFVNIYDDTEFLTNKKIPK